MLALTGLLICAIGTTSALDHSLHVITSVPNLIVYKNTTSQAFVSDVVEATTFAIAGARASLKDLAEPSATDLSQNYTSILSNIGFVRQLGYTTNDRTCFSSNNLEDVIGTILEPMTTKELDRDEAILDILYSGNMDQLTSGGKTTLQSWVVDGKDAQFLSLTFIDESETLTTALVGFKSSLLSSSLSLTTRSAIVTYTVNTFSWDEWVVVSNIFDRVRDTIHEKLVAASLLGNISEIVRPFSETATIKEFVPLTPMPCQKKYMGDAIVVSSAKELSFGMSSMMYTTLLLFVAIL